MKELYSYAGFSKNADGCAAENVWFQTYKKLKINNENAYHNDEGFVICCGTLIYKENTGKRALEEMLNDYLAGMTLTEIRQNCYGQYAGALCDGHTIYVFVDETGCYSYYYFYDNQKREFLFCNMLAHLQACVKSSFDEITAAAIISHCGRVPFPNTVFSQIKRLRADEVLTIELTSCEVHLGHVQLNDYKRKFENFGEAVDALEVEVRKYMKVRDKLFCKPEILMTGGSDSRLMLASYLASEKRPVINYWVGKDGITNTKTMDKDIVEMIARKENLEYCLKNIDSDFCEDWARIGNREFCKYGEYMLHYGFNHIWVDMMENGIQGDYLDSGLSGEILAEKDSITAHKKGFKSVWEFTKQEWGGDGWVDIELLKGLSDKVFTFVNQFFMHDFRVIDNCQSAIDQQMAIAEIDSMRPISDGMLHNFINLFRYSNCMLFEKKTMDIASCIPYEWKKEYRLNIALLNRLYPQLVSYPYFCHCEERLYDSITNSLTYPVEKLRKEKVKHFLQKFHLFNFAKYLKDKIVPQHVYQYQDDSEIVQFILDALDTLDSYRATNIEITTQWSGYVAGMYQALMWFTVIDLADKY